MDSRKRNFQNQDRDTKEGNPDKRRQRDNSTLLQQHRNRADRFSAASKYAKQHNITELPENQEAKGFSNQQENNFDLDIFTDTSSSSLDKGKGKGKQPKTIDELRHERDNEDILGTFTLSNREESLKTYNEKIDILQARINKGEKNHRLTIKEER